MSLTLQVLFLTLICSLLSVHFVSPLSPPLPRRAFLASAPLLFPCVFSATAAQATSDEFTIKYNPTRELGFELADVTFAKALRVQVASISPNSQAFEDEEFKAYVRGRRTPFDPRKPNLIVSAVNGISTERTNTRGVQIFIREEMKKQEGGGTTIAVTLKSSDGFANALSDLEVGAEEASSRVGPGKESGKEGEGKEGGGEIVSVSQIQAPLQAAKSAAKSGDLIEVEFSTAFVEIDPNSGEEKEIIFDYSGRGGDNSIQFVLKKQPFGQFPPALDVGLEGAKCGEIRQIRVPASLGYGKEGLRRRGGALVVPPESDLVYRAKVKSINGVFM